MREYLPGIMRVFSNITPILIFFIFAQIIDVEELGLINYFLSLITIVGVFTDFGLPEAIQRFLPQVKEKTKLIGYTIKLELLIVLLGAFIFIALDIISKGTLSKGYIILLTLIFLFSASNTIILIFNGLEDKSKVTKYFSYSSILFLLITLSFYFIFKFDPVISFISGRLISWVIYTIIPTINLIKNNFVKNERFVLKSHPRFNNFALNTFIYTGSITLLTQWDSILITSIDSAYTNGLYKSVAFIATIPIVLVTILHTRLLPLFSKLNAKKNFNGIKTELNKTVKYLLILLITVFIIQFFIYKPILNIFLSQEIVQQTGHLFPLILLSVSLHILTAPYIAVLQAIGKENWIRNITLSQVSIFIITSILFYPIYSYEILPILLILINASVLIIFFSLTTKSIYTKINKVI